MKKLLVLALCSWMTVAIASEFGRVEAAIEAFDQHVAQIQVEFAKKEPNPNDKTWVQAKLAYMVELDQYARFSSGIPARLGFTDDDSYEYNQRMFGRWAYIDRQNTADLKKLLKVHPWFTISEFGWEANKDAWLIVQHADHDVALQREVLAFMEPLVAPGETDRQKFAYLYDRVATNFQNPAERKLQRYGTQGECTGAGQWEPFPVEDPAKLDERRASVYLGTEAEYKELFVQICRGIHRAK